MKKITALFFTVLLSLLVIGCAQEQTSSTWEQIEEKGYFVLGLDDTFAPMGFRDDNGDLVGFDVDLAKEVALRLGIEVVFQSIDWDSKVLELNSKTIDMIWNGLTITDSRLLEMSFSEPYLANSQIIIVNSDSSVDQISDLEGLSVGVQISSASEEAVVGNDIYSSLGEFVKYDTFNFALLDLKNGTIDAVVIDEIMGRYMLSQVDDTYKICLENFGTEEYGIGFRLEDTDFRDMVNQVLLEMILDGTTAEISVKWFDEDVFLNRE
ncbi:MAG: amino acid ABC transporter substrate-binding protein [Firmicutes bacterium]|nr:amino acid ABC transporter substrate-binding protein [Bacillota bacterium]